ncbi:MAG: SRPBCC family protein [bacterium]
MLKKILIGIVGLVVLLAVVGLLIPSSYRVERSIQINAPVETVFAQVVDVKNWENWSPWKEQDPTINTTYGDVTSGIGGHFSWTSENSGDGSLTITEVEENRKIKTDLDFGDQGTANGFWMFTQNDEGVKVTWGFSGDFGYNLMGRYIGLMMDSFAGPDLEKGLANLKKTAEAMPVPETEQITEKQ